MLLMNRNTGWHQYKKSQLIMITLIYDAENCFQQEQRLLIIVGLWLDNEGFTLIHVSPADHQATHAK